MLKNTFCCYIGEDFSGQYQCTDGDGTKDKVITVCGKKVYMPKAFDANCLLGE
jgi:hypothetical protein